MGTVDKKLNDYIWEHIGLLEAIFSEKIYKILLRFKDKEDKESFSDTLEAVVEVDSELLENLEIVYQNFKNGIENELKLDEVYFQRGKKFHDEKNYVKAMEHYQKAIKINSKSDYAYFNIAHIYKNKKNYTKAIEYYQKVIEINAKADDAYQNIGLIYSDKKEYDKAIEYYQKAIEINPYDTSAYNNIGVDYGNKNENDKSLKYYQKAISLNRKGNAFNNLNILMNKLNKAFFLDKKISNLNFFINKIKIKNFKQYKNFSINLSKQINIIIGQNAIGKTTLLQAITLGLLKEDSSDAKKVEYDDYISKAQTKAELIIYHNDEEKKVEILKEKREIEENYFIPFVLAYGSNFFTSKTNEVKEVVQGIVNETIHKDFTSSIFVDFTNGFVNPIRLLEFLDLEKDDKVQEIQQTFIDVINSFLEGFELVANDKNYYFQRDGEETRLKLEDLSEGYRSNVLLITDMLIKILGVGWTPKTIEGIVLIDEFDKHLHPKWQSKLVNQLTKTFPKIQFIMTTHNPMSILDRNPDEVTILREIDGGIKAIKKRVGTKKIGVSTVLLEYFGVDSTVSGTMKSKIDEFTKLKLKDTLTVEEEKKIIELEEFLDETVATNFIYNRAYFNFLKFLKKNKNIDFEKYEKISNEEMEELLLEYKDLFE